MPPKMRDSDDEYNPSSSDDTDSEDSVYHSEEEDQTFEERREIEDAEVADAQEAMSYTHKMSKEEVQQSLQQQIEERKGPMLRSRGRKRGDLSAEDEAFIVVCFFLALVSVLYTH